MLMVWSSTEDTLECVCKTTSYDLLLYIDGPWRVRHKFISLVCADRLSLNSLSCNIMKASADLSVHTHRNSAHPLFCTDHLS